MSYHNKTRVRPATIGWAMYILGVILCAAGGYANAGMVPLLTLLGVGCVVGAVAYGLSKLEF